MQARLEAFWQLVVQTFTQPAADPAASALILSGILIVALIVVMGLLLAITPRRRAVVKVVQRRKVAGPEAAGEHVDAQTAEQPAEEPAEAPAEEPPATVEPAVEPAPRAKPRPTGPAARILGAVAVPLLVFAAVVATYVVTGTDQYCAGVCHAREQATMDALELDHARCIQCHEDPGLAGTADASLARARMVVNYALGERSSGAAIVDSSACERCHRKTIEQTAETSRGIRVSHAEPTAAGTPCTSCHTGTGHQERQAYSMSDCVVCHDGAQASGECETCHLGDPYAPTRAEGSGDSTGTIGSGEVLFPAVKIGSIGCGGCHDEKAECDTCHGLRMPHSREFLDYAHAPLGAFERKTMCYKCHEPRWCSSGCHIGFPGHAGNWRQDHQSAGWDASCACHDQRDHVRTEPMCTLCH